MIWSGRIPLRLWSTVQLPGSAAAFQRRLCSSISHFWAGDEPSPQLDWDYILSPDNTDEIAANVSRRKGVGDVRRVRELHAAYRLSSLSERPAALTALVAAALRLPNRSRPRLSDVAESDEMVLVRTVGHKRRFDFPVKDFQRRARKLNMFRMNNLGLLTGSRTYYLKCELAQMEMALVRFALTTLMKAGFQLVSVPDLLNSSVVEACGVPVHSDRTMVGIPWNYHSYSENWSATRRRLPGHVQSLFIPSPSSSNFLFSIHAPYDLLTNEQVYSLDSRRHGDVCLSGTAEMGLAALLSHCRLPASRLPLRMAAVSRCFRPEISNLESESGLYRVHQFTKVEMFGVCAGELSASAALLDEFVHIQQRIFTALALHFVVYDMPPNELGAAAYQKYDVEAWMAGRGLYGEVSSASNCTDYQSRRLDVRDEGGRHLHTVNGTACAVPRTLLALVEAHQNSDGSVAVPQPLAPLLGTTVLRPQPGTSQWLRSHQLRLQHEPDHDSAPQPLENLLSGLEAPR